MVANNGYETETLAQTAFTAFYAAAQLQTEWEKCFNKEDWMNVADQAIAMFDTKTDSDEIHVPVKDAADSLRRAYQAGKDDLPEYDKLRKYVKLSWEAVARHLFNCITADADSISIPEMEAHWGPWARKKLEGVLQ